eukprot:EG_transcript_20726
MATTPSDRRPVDSVLTTDRGRPADASVPSPTANPGRLSPARLSRSTSPTGFEAVSADMLSVAMPDQALARPPSPVGPGSALLLQQVVQELQLLRGQLPGEIHQELLDLRLANLSLEATVHRLQEELRALRAQQEHQAATAAMPSPNPPASGSHTPEELQRMHQMYLQA